MVFEKYVQEMHNIGKKQAFELSIKLRWVLLLWYTARVDFLFNTNKIEIFDFIVFGVVLSSMAVNLLFWRGYRLQSRNHFLFFSALESFLIVYSALLLDDYFLLFLLAGSNSMTIFMQDRHLTLVSGIISFLLYTCFSLYEKMDVYKYIFHISVLLVYFKINYFIADIIEKYKQEIKHINIKKDFNSILKSFFFHNTFATYGTYTFESQVLQSEEFGGDIIAVFPISENEIVGIVGDINSHGNEIFPGALICSIAFKSISRNQKDPKAILEILNEMLLPIDEHQGGSGLFFVFHLDADGLMTYAGGLFDGSVRINNTNLSLNKINIIGQTQSTQFKNFTRQLKHGDKVTISTDGWGGVYNKLDDKSKLKITYFGIPKKHTTSNHKN
jgi:hypothetical protein